MLRTKFFRAYLVDAPQQPWWHNRLAVYWGRKPAPKLTPKGVDRGDHPHKLRLEWRLFSRSNNPSLSFQVGSEDERDVMVSVGIPWLLSLYVTHSIGRWFTDRVLPWHQSNESIGWRLDREIRLYVFEGRANVSLWTHPIDGNYGDYGETALPKWRSFSFSVNPLDLLGTFRCTHEILEPEHPVLIPLPEGDYEATLKVERMVWTRRWWPRWPFKRQRTYRYIECRDGIPFSGKGENPWDCGEDGRFGTGYDVEVAGTDEKACALFAASVLETRRKRGDPRVWPESPRDRAARIANMRVVPRIAEATSGKEKQP